MLSEAQRAELIDHLEKNVEWRYPLDGADQYYYNPDVFVYRKGEPVSKKFPAIQVSFERRGSSFIRGLGNVIKDYSGALVYGYGELETVMITVYTHQACKAANGYVYHGKIVADSYTRRIERYMRRYWPRMLQDMEAYIYNPMSWIIDDISQFTVGNEIQGYEMVMHISSTNKWDYNNQDLYTGVKNASGTPRTGAFEDAIVSGMDQVGYDAGLPYDKYFSVSGEMSDME